MLEEKFRFSNLKVDDVKNNLTVRTFIESANQYLGAIGYTEHGLRHVSIVATIAQNILAYLGYSKRFQELAAMAGYLHDIGNIINRKEHGQSAALIALRLLKDMGATPDEIAFIISAIGNHEEEIGDPVNVISAAVILADKSDVHKTRVRNKKITANDIHDRVNDAAEHSFLNVSKEKKLISLHLTINTNKSQVMEYFEIFMSRMLMCTRAATFLGCRFELIINERKLL